MYFQDIHLFIQIRCLPLCVMKWKYAYCMYIQKYIQKNKKEVRGRHYLQEAGQRLSEIRWCGFYHPNLRFRLLIWDLPVWRPLWEDTLTFTPAGVRNYNSGCHTMCMHIFEYRKPESPSSGTSSRRHLHASCEVFLRMNTCLHSSTNTRRL